MRHRTPRLKDLKVIKDFNDPNDLKVPFPTKIIRADFTSLRGQDGIPPKILFGLDCS